MKPTIYLHIGTPKTGTTTIQHLFLDNKEYFASKDLLFPVLKTKSTTVGQHRNAHFLTDVRLDENGERIPSLPCEEFDTIMDQLVAYSKDYSRILLTDEALWRGRPARTKLWYEIKDAFEKRDLNVKIIVYLRRQDLWITSHWSQRIKEGVSTVSIMDHVEYLEKDNYPLDYYKKLSFLAELFGKEALIVRVFEREQFVGKEKNLISDFLSIFDLEITDDLVIGEPSSNEKLSHNYLELRRILAHHPDFRGMYMPEITDLQRENVFGYDFSKADYYSEGEDKQVMEKFEASNALVAKEFLDREDGRLFYSEKYTKGQAFEPDTRELLNDTILYFATQMKQSTSVTVVTNLQKQTETLEKELLVAKKQMQTYESRIKLLEKKMDELFIPLHKRIIRKIKRILFKAK